MIKQFIDKYSISEDDLKYSAGTVKQYDDGRFIVAYQQRGAEDTFSVGMPVYDENDYKMGYLGIGLFNNLDYADRYNGESIPVYHWEIMKPTSYCKPGKKVFTYWQRYNCTSIGSDNDESTE